MADQLTEPFFADLMTQAGFACPPVSASGIAVAVSGGADSVALLYVLDRWVGAVGGGCPIHVLTVDHGLRPESRDEVEYVAALAQKLGHECRIFRWDPSGITTGVQEKARAARYDMMTRYCEEQGIGFLFLAHHADDQSETFFYRLAKGSGVDGLACMRKRRTEGGSGVTLVRPLLPVTHADLVETCRAAGLSWVEDPSNDSPKYMRGRLRSARAILEEEGLTAARITKLTDRISRLCDVIETMVDRVEADIRDESSDGEISFSLSGLRAQPEEIRLRLLQRCFRRLFPDRDYPVRLEDLERLAERIGQDGYRGSTLGGLRFAPRNRLDRLVITLENSPSREDDRTSPETT